MLGAGFSAPAGIPLADELLRRVRNDIRSFHRARANRDGPLEREIKEWCELYPEQDLNLELVLAYSHRKHHLRLLGSKEYFAHGSVTIAAARTAIQEILIATTPSETPTLYREFSKRLVPRDVVLTFNYDTLLEQALDDVGKPYTLTPEWWLANDAQGQRYVDILKLHGSIDWYDRHYHDDAMRWHREQRHDVPDKDPIFGPNPTVPLEPLSRGEVEVFGSNILPRVFRVPNHKNYFPITGGAGSNVVPFILPLAYDKLLGYDPILDLWENLHRTLDTFSTIVLIGYSMPRHDSYAYEALGRLFVEYQRGGEENAWDQRRVPIQIITLAPSEPDALIGMPFLEPAKTRVWHRGFDQGALNWLDWGDGAGAPDSGDTIEPGASQ